MNDWNEGYFTSSTYTYGYYRELSPTFQKFCLLMRGFDSPPFDQNSRHCELGYGQGVSVNIHAASTPGHYVGTDFNPAHAAHANELNRASGSGAELFEDSFEQLLTRFNEYDHRGEKYSSIGLHGIWSWISNENRKYIVEIIRRHLKSGGVVYNSYNCFPGWAPAAPLRELLAVYDKFIGGNEINTSKRVDAALKFAAELLAAKPIYAFRVPELNAKLEQLKKQDHNYLAHEYLNRDWDCMYFSEVAELMSTAKLDYACTATLLDAIDQLNLSAAAQQFLNAIGNPIIREQARDYFVNAQFRKDLYVRGARRLSAPERMKRLLNMCFVKMSTAPFPTKIATPAGETVLDGRLLNLLSEYLEENDFQPKTFDEFVQQNNIPYPVVEQMLIMLVNNNAVMPCQSEETVNQVRSKCHALNDYICRRAETSQEIFTLASPVLGGGFNIGRFEQMMISIFKRGLTTPEEIARAIWENMKRRGEMLIIPSKKLETPEENLTELQRIAKNFVEKQLPILRALQIV